MAFKYPMFDCFLKKNLSLNVYNQVKTFESCVIYSNSDKYLYRFVFVTDQNIAATENPPKSILWKTDFTEIVKIEKKFDCPVFIPKKIKDCVQHIYIQLKQHLSVNQETSSATSTQKSPLNEIHLYILNKESSIFNLLYFLWISCIMENKIEITLDENDSKIKVAFSHIHQKIVSLFQNTVSPEIIYQIFHDLKLLLNKSMIAKSLFWRSDEFLQLSTNYLSKFLNLNSSSQSDRADELECSALIIEVICVALTKVETSDFCQNIIGKCSQDYFLKLINLLIPPPKLNHHLQNVEEIILACSEYTKNCSQLIYKFLLLLDSGLWYHNSWSQRPYKNLTVTKNLFSSMISGHSNLKVFMKVNINKFFQIWTNDKIQLNLNETKDIYHILYVVNHFVSVSKSLKDYLKVEFSEKFKYIVEPIIDKKLSSDSLVCMFTKDILHQLIITLK